MKAVITLLLGALALAAPVAAQTVYRCKAKNGHVSIQSAPCPAGASQTTKTMYTWDNPEVAARTRAVQAEMDRRNRASADASVYVGSVYRPPTQSDRKRARCDSAKAERDARLKQVGLRRTFDLLRQLDDMVYQACK